jgi:Na+-translocating ferredoxin:NAD+ oxidoreductase subunit B
MFELQNILTEVLGLLQLPDIYHFLVPHVGVGGGVEAREYVPLLPILKYTLIFLAGIGTIFGIGLSIAAKKFSVKIDPKIEQVLDVLAHAH